MLGMARGEREAGVHTGDRCNDSRVRGTPVCVPTAPGSLPPPHPHAGLCVSLLDSDALETLCKSGAPAACGAQFQGLRCIFSLTLEDRYYHSHCTEEATEAQRGQVICPEPHRKRLTQNPNPSSSGPEQCECLGRGSVRLFQRGGTVRPWGGGGGPPSGMWHPGWAVAEAKPVQAGHFLQTPSSSSSPLRTETQQNPFVLCLKIGRPAPVGALLPLHPRLSPNSSGSQGPSRPSRQLTVHTAPVASAGQ